MVNKTAAKAVCKSQTAIQRHSSTTPALIWRLRHSTQPRSAPTARMRSPITHTGRRERKTRSPLANTVVGYLKKNSNIPRAIIGRDQDSTLKTQTLDAISNPATCVVHRANVSATQQQAIVQQLLNAGLADPADNATFPGGLINGIYPPRS